AGTYERSFETEVAGVRMRAPMMDIHTVAAGGGSICSISDGRFQVGPQSAGANPGPACYRRGGPITVTDCNVLLGALSPKHFPSVFGPNGDQPLDVDAVRNGFEALKASSENDQSVESMAQGFLNIAVENMANAIKKISVEQGHDITKYTLQSFGGAGGQHACLVAETLGIKKVLIHPFAGVLSAFGMGLADITALREGQLDCAIDDYATVQPALNRLERDAKSAVVAQGIANPMIKTRAHLRYEGQHQALEVAFGPPEDMRAAFEDAHQARFGFSSPERAVQFEMLSVEAIGATGTDPDIPVHTGDGALRDTQRLYRDAWVDAKVYDRANLQHGVAIEGPAIILEPTGTNVIEPGWIAELDTRGNILMTHVSQVARVAIGTSVDPIQLEVMSNRFMSIADQMGATLANTSWSVNIKERLDFSCAIF
ncbi:MAG: hydantoinase/oxoprolinase family protein, partial [Planktomarina sp.]